MNTYAKALYGALALAAAQPALAQDERSSRPDRQEGRERSGDWRLHLSSGFSFSTRDSDTTGRTDYYRVPLGARVARGPLRFSASIPYIFVSGQGTSIGDDGEISDLPSDDRNRSGWGDLRLTGRYRLPAQTFGGFELDLMGQVKLPTASAKERLGTGEVDFAIGGEISRDVGKFEPFVSAQYRFNGDRPDLDYRNTVSTSVGTAVRLSRRARATLAYDYAQSRIDGRSGIHRLDAGLSARLTRRVTISTSGSVGLSERAPDFSVGTSVSWRAF